jgi:hypothetical protein
VPDQPRFVTKKVFKLRPRISGTDDPTSIQTEVLTPSEEVTVSEYAFFSCGHRFDPTKAFEDEFTGLIVCEDRCVVECHQCGTKLYVRAAHQSLTGDYFCPDCLGLWPVVRFLEKLFFKK